MKKILLLSVFVSVAHILPAQKNTCCSVASGQGMAAFATDRAFVKAHKNPKAFTYQSAAGKMIRFPAADGQTANAYEVKASSPTNKYVFVFQEWWGLNDYIKKESDQIYASLGGKVNVIAIDLYDGKIATTRDSAGAYMQAAKPERLVSIIKGALTFVGTKAEIVTIGWCFGGGWSLQAALLAGTQDKGCVMYYGSPETDAAKLSTLNGELLGIFASQDKWITPEVVNAFDANLTAAGKKHTIKQFDADHAFANPSNPQYNKVYTEEAYALSIAFIKKCFMLK